MLHTKRNDTQRKAAHSSRPAHTEQPQLTPARSPAQGDSPWAYQGRYWGQRRIISISLGLLCCLGALLFSPTPPAYAQSMDEGLVGYWPFDEGSGNSSADRSGNGNTATLSAGASFTTRSAPMGLSNPSALTFQGAAEATATSNGLDNLQQLTIAAWVRLTDHKGVQRFVTLGDENAVLRYDSGLHFYVKLNGHLVGQRINITVTPDDYHHVAGTYDGAMLRVYLDGNLVGSAVVSGTLGSGNGLHFSSSAEPLHGDLDEVRIYNRALTASAIRGLTFNCATVSLISPTECQALVALYASTNGAEWTHDNQWLRTNEPCFWSDFLCLNQNSEQYYHIILLRLPGYGLRGTIPPDLSNLTKLTRVDFSANQLSGAIPAELGNLTELTDLDLSANQLSGAIPAELGNLTKLTDLDLSANQLSGVIPAELGNLTKLARVDLSANQLSSAIPATFCDLPAATIDWRYNKFLPSASCLATRYPSWMNTQTMPPSDVRAQLLTSQRIQLTWSPILYTADSGYYRVLAGSTAGGPYTEVAQTANKMAGGITLGPFAVGIYHLVVRTLTPKHGGQQNDLTSDNSIEVVVVVNTPPVAADATLTVTQDSPLPIHLAASDVDTDPLHYLLADLPSHGALRGAAPDLIYTPAPAFTGEDRFTFKVNDGKADSNLATITLHVVAGPPGNTPPIAQDDTFTVTRNSQATVFAVLTNDQDADGDALLLIAVTPPLNGTVEIIDGQLRYTPAPDFVGADRFTYTVSDGKTSAVAAVNVTVAAPVGGTASQAIYLPFVQR
ncbi:MAG: Ig-like domain-containing protein [Caldilineaceae bacterium]